MRAAILLAALVALPAQAELYRWRDPQSGSIKFSSLPPPWYGDPQKEKRAPPVEVVPDLSPRREAAAPPSTVSALEAQFAALLQYFRAIPAGADFERTGAALLQQAEIFRAVSAELDRQDPAGAARRRAAAQQSGVVEALKQGVEAQFSPQSPPPPSAQR